jgi:hypothetical protein
MVGSSSGTRSAAGRRGRDTFASWKKTCRKLGVRFWAYLCERVRGRGEIPPGWPNHRQEAADADARAYRDRDEAGNRLAGRQGGLALAGSVQEQHHAGPVEKSELAAAPKKADMEHLGPTVCVVAPGPLTALYAIILSALAIFFWPRR